MLFHRFEEHFRPIFAHLSRSGTQFKRIYDNPGWLEGLQLAPGGPARLLYVGLPFSFIFDLGVLRDSARYLCCLFM